MKRLKQAVCAVLAASLVAGSGFASYAGPADDIAAAEAQGTTVTYPEKTEAAVSDAPFVREIEELIEARKTAKKEKNYAEADRIRAYLLEKGVTLIDTKDGTSYTIG